MNRYEASWHEEFKDDDMITGEMMDGFHLKYIARSMDMIIDRLSDIATILNTRTEPVDDTPTTATLQQRAEYNKQHAAELYSDKLVFYHGRWYTRDTGEPVVFTPYGWIKG